MDGLGGGQSVGGGRGGLGNCSLPDIQGLAMSGELQLVVEGGSRGSNLEPILRPLWSPTIILIQNLLIRVHTVYPIGHFTCCVYSVDLCGLLPLFFWASEGAAPAARWAMQKHNSSRGVPKMPTEFFPSPIRAPNAQHGNAVQNDQKLTYWPPRRAQTSMTNLGE